MRRRSRMAGQRFGVAQIDQALDQTESVVERDGTVKPAADPEGHERASPAPEILSHETMVRMIREAGIADPGHAGIGAQELRDLSRIFHMALDAKRDRLDAEEQQKSV